MGDSSIRGHSLSFQATRTLKRLMPGAEIDIIPRCGHLPQAERPEEFCDIVMRFAGKG